MNDKRFKEIREKKRNLTMEEIPTTMEGEPHIDEVVEYLADDEEEKVATLMMLLMDAYNIEEKDFEIIKGDIEETFDKLTEQEESYLKKAYEIVTKDNDYIFRDFFII